MTTPDQLEREILEAIRKVGPNGSPIHYTEAALKMFRKELREVAEKAIDDLIDRNTSKSPVAKILRQQYERDKIEWPKENNLLNDNT